MRGKDVLAYAFGAKLSGRRVATPGPIARAEGCPSYLRRREAKHPSRLRENPVLTATRPQRHLIGVEVAFAVRLGAGMLMVLAKLRGVGLGR